ncbi:hypothetical protein IV102_19625 [bacterium]|nr:hypothetical protein [bacterium]
MSIVLAPSAVAQSAQDQAEIRSAYARAALGAKYKVVDTMLSLRAPGFETLAQDGSRVNAGGDRARCAALFRTATRVRLVFDVKSFETKKNGITCSARHVFEVETVNPITAKLEASQIESLVEDYWIKTPVGWKIWRSQVKQQRVLSLHKFKPDPDMPVW